MTAREITSFSQAVHRDAVVVEAHGELDVVSAPTFRAAVADAVATGRPLVVVDLAHVQFLDSAGLAVVFGAQRTLPVSQRMTLANVPDRMRRMLRLAAVDSVVDVHAPGEPQPWLDHG
jgi:anti-sigma B factor antagonist